MTTTPSTSRPLESPDGGRHVGLMSLAPATRFFRRLGALWPFLLRRLFGAVLVLFVTSLLTFLLGYYGPGDPAQVLLGQHTNPVVKARIRHQLGLDRPPAVQYLGYIGGALHGDLGTSISFRPGQPVAGLVWQRALVSFQLACAALLLAFLVGIPSGLWAAWRRNRPTDYLLTSLNVLGVSAPSFLVGPLLLAVFAFTYHIFPSEPGWDGLFSAKIVLPAFTLSLLPGAVLARQTRANVIEVLGQDYVRTAQAKGVPLPVLLTRHVLRNALIPIVTYSGLLFGVLTGSTILVEAVFGIPGAGLLALNSALARDYPVVIGNTMFISAVFIVLNLLVDLLYPFIDPRVAYDQ